MLRKSFVIAFAVAPCIAALVSLPLFAQEDEPAPSYPLHVFDVSALLAPVEDFPGPRFELSPGRSLLAVMRRQGSFDSEEEKKPRLMSSYDLEDLIRGADATWESEDDGCFLKLLNGRLYVRGPAPNVKSLESLLKTLEEEASRSFSVKAVVVSVPRGKVETLLGTPATLMSATDAEKRLAAASEPGLHIVGQTAVCALNGQLVHIVDGRERSFVVDYDVEVAQKSAVADPIVEVLRDGLILEVRPFDSPSRRRVRLDLYLGYTRFLPKPRHLDPKNPRLGPLDLPRLSGFRMETSVALPTDDYLLLGPLLPSGLNVPGSEKGGTGGEKNGTGNDRDRDERELYVLVQVKRVGK